MDDALRYLVDGAGRIYTKDDADSYEDVAVQHGLDERSCQEFRFDLTTRQLRVDRGATLGLHAIRAYLDAHLGSPEKLMDYARAGSLPKQSLSHLLAIDRRTAYLAACAAIEKRYTDECAPANGACLESGCSAEGEVCLQPLLRREDEYRKACGAEWVKVFANPHNRVDAWKN